VQEGGALERDLARAEADAHRRMALPPAQDMDSDEVRFLFPSFFFFLFQARFRVTRAHLETSYG